MEEERYYIENDMIIDEDKWIKGEQDITIGDTDNLDDIVDLLNQLDKQIKELEEENGYIIFSDSYDENGIAIHEQKFVKYKDIFKKLVDENKKLKQENQQLKEYLEQIENIKAVEFIDAIKHYEQQIRELKVSQKELAISELEKVENILWDSQDIGNLMDNDKFLEKLNYRIKSLKGE